MVLTVVETESQAYGTPTYQNRLRRPVWIEGIGAPMLRRPEDVLTVAPPPAQPKPQVIVATDRFQPMVFEPKPDLTVSPPPPPTTLPPPPPEMPNAGPGAQAAPPIPQPEPPKTEPGVPVVWKPSPWLWVGAGIAGTVTVFTLWWLIARRKK